MMKNSSFERLRNENKSRKTPWLSRRFFHPRHWGEMCLLFFVAQLRNSNELLLLLVSFSVTLESL